MPTEGQWFFSHIHAYNVNLYVENILRKMISYWETHCTGARGTRIVAVVCRQGCGSGSTCFYWCGSGKGSSLNNFVQPPPYMWPPYMGPEGRCAPSLSWAFWSRRNSLVAVRSDTFFSSSITRCRRWPFSSYTWHTKLTQYDKNITTRISRFAHPAIFGKGPEFKLDADRILFNSCF